MKVLMVLTSHDQLGDTGKKTGFWLEEFAAPYYVLKDAGHEITLASPKGGQPPLDPKSDEPARRRMPPVASSAIRRRRHSWRRQSAWTRFDRQISMPSSIPAVTARCGISPKTRTRRH